MGAPLGIKHKIRHWSRGRVQKPPQIPLSMSCCTVLPTEDKVKWGNESLSCLSTSCQVWFHFITNSFINCIITIYYYKGIISVIWLGALKLIIISSWQNHTNFNVEVNSTNHSIPNPVINHNNYKPQIKLHWKEPQTPLQSVMFQSKDRETVTTRWKRVTTMSICMSQSSNNTEQLLSYQSCQIEILSPKVCFIAALTA